VVKGTCVMKGDCVVKGACVVKEACVEGTSVVIMKGKVEDGGIGASAVVKEGE